MTDAVIVSTARTGLAKSWRGAFSMTHPVTFTGHVLREAIIACKPGGVLSIPGVYGGFLDKIPFGAAFGKGLTMKMGQTNMHNYMKPLLERIEKNQIDPSYIISHRITLDKAPEMYKVWRDKKEDVTKIVIDPWQ